MKASVLPRFLLGSREAITQVAASPSALLIGVLFTISAGFAREYDGEDLLHEPWHALRPLGASLISGTVLFGLIHGICSCRDPENQRPTPARAYITFMTLFWMTAPMAWLYAIPYEQWLSPVDAIRVNLWTLALVSAWRVLLITRIISVLYGVGSVGAFFLVMLFADVVTFAAVQLMPAPIIDFMGGLRHSDRDALVSEITILVTFFSVLSAPVWILGSLVAIGLLKPRWPSPKPSESAQHSRGVMMVALVSLAAAVPLLIWAQPEQINQARAERLLRAGRVSEAFAQMSEHRQSDFPPHWNPPPRRGYAERDPDLALVRAAMLENWPADWVADLYLNKIQTWTRRELFPYFRAADWEEIADEYEPWGDRPEEFRVLSASLVFLRDHDNSLTDQGLAAIDRVLETIESHLNPAASSDD